jgi:hypothetical protein
MIIANKRRDRRDGVVERRDGEVVDEIMLGMYDHCCRFIFQAATMESSSSIARGVA